MDNRALRREYKELDTKLTDFRKRWNKKAHDDIEYSLIHHSSKGKQEDFPEWWYVDVARWRQLKSILNIK